ncbi:hypothetical protein ACLB2K_000544 [Fragaria x ananassa]
MLLRKPTSKTPRKLPLPYQNSIFSCLYQPQNPAYIYTQKSNYVNVYMKWKKDSYFDTIEHIDKSIVLKPIINLKNCITEDPNGCIPIYQVSKRGFALDVPMKVAKFLRKYPSIFEQFSGEYNYPWFKLTPKAAEIDKEEKRVYEDCREDLRDRLKKLILMSIEKVLPLKIIQGMEWYLGLPFDFLHYPEKNLDGSFMFVKMEDGLEGLAVNSGEKVLSVVQRNAMKKRVYSGGPTEAVEFSRFPSKGLRLRNKIKDWLEEFQKLPYVSPYENSSHLQPDSDASEKRCIGFSSAVASEKEVYYVDEGVPVILKNRRVNSRLAGGGNMELDLEHKIEDRGKADLDLESENVDNRDGKWSRLEGTILDPPACRRARNLVPTTPKGLNHLQSITWAYFPRRLQDDPGHESYKFGFKPIYSNKEKGLQIEA